MAKIYVYTRVSTKEQEEALAAQDRQAMVYSEMIKQRYGIDAEIIGPLREKYSAFKFSFSKRPQGKILMQLLESGDHIVFARVDRFARLKRDFENQLHEWKQKGVTVHFADIGLDLSTPIGSMMASMLAVIAQYFSESLSERVRMAYRERYVYGTQYPKGRVQLIQKLHRPGKPPLAVANRKTLIYLRYVVACRRRSYLRNGVPDSWDTCCDALEMARVAHGELEEYRPRWSRGQWRSVNVCLLLRRLMKSQLPALNTERITAYFRRGLDPFKLGQRKPDKPSPRRKRQSFFDGVEREKLFRRPPKRWATKHDCCVECGTTEWPHYTRGLCRPCCERIRKAEAASKATGG
jgi:DNA invertase Pin-like site-specific DNA recombinase